jgi:hypothetical protein
LAGLLIFSLPGMQSVMGCLVQNLFNVLDDVVSLEFGSDKTTVRHLDHWVDELIAQFFESVFVVLCERYGGLEGKFLNFVVMGPVEEEYQFLT